VNRRVYFLAVVFLFSAAALSATRFAAQSPQQPAQTPSPLLSPAQQILPPQTQSTQTPPPLPLPARPTLNVVVLDPAHGGTDTGARGSGGIRESEVLLNFSTQVRKALESTGIRVVETRQGNDNPSFDDRSAIANGQRGAVFITLHISSTGPPSTVRVYIFAPPYELGVATPAASPATNDRNGLLSWDRAQIPFLPLSQHLAELTQIQLTHRFRGSPGTHLAAAVRQLRNVAAPAIAIELSSVSVEDRATLFEMAPNLAEGVARAVTSFRSYYDAAPSIPSSSGGN